MQHRHLTDDARWSRAAVDSALERGTLVDWRELFAAARKDCELAATILEIAEQHHVDGASALAKHLVAKL